MLFVAQTQPSNSRGSGTASQQSNNSGARNTLRTHSAHTPDTLRALSGYISDTLRTHFGHFLARSGHTLNTLWTHCGHTLDTLRTHCGHTYTLAYFGHTQNAFSITTRFCRTYRVCSAQMKWVHGWVGLFALIMINNFFCITCCIKKLTLNPKP